MQVCLSSAATSAKVSFYLHRACPEPSRVRTVACRRVCGEPWDMLASLRDHSGARWPAHGCFTHNCINWAVIAACIAVRSGLCT